MMRKLRTPPAAFIGPLDTTARPDGMPNAPRPSLAAALLALAFLSGCGGAARPTPASAPATAVAPRPVNPADHEFIEGMIHHHAQALVMAELARRNEAGPGVRLLAERIHVSQTDEIALMQLWLSDMGLPHVEPSPMGMAMDPAAHDHHHHGHHLMPGMLTPEQLEQLENARGTEFDRLFLRFMIMHHEGAIHMVDQLLASEGAANDEFIYRLASDVYADQGIEIDRMEQMLEALGQ